MSLHDAMIWFILHNDNCHHILISLKLTSTIGCMDLHNPHHSAANWMINNCLLLCLQSCHVHSVQLETFPMFSDSDLFQFRRIFNSLDELISTMPPSPNSFSTWALKWCWFLASTIFDVCSKRFKDVIRR